MTLTNRGAGTQARLLPNFIHHMWTLTKDGGLAASMYHSPSLRGIVSPSVVIQCQ
jgi:hypothetical protein